MNLSSNDEMKLVINLMFSDEERHTVLWSRGCEDLMLKLLVSPEEFSQLHWVESELEKAKKEVDALKGEIEKTQQKISDKEKIASYLRASLSELAESQTEESIKAYDILSAGVQELRIRRSGLDSDFRLHLQENAKLLDELKRNDAEMLTTRGRQDKLEIERLRIFLTPEEPHAEIFMTHLLKEKKCPYCLADVSAQVQQRQDAKVCLFCGNAISIVPGREVTAISNEIDLVTSSLDKINENRRLLEKELAGSEEQISKVEIDRQHVLAEEADLETRLEKAKDVERLRQRRSTTAQELKDVQEGLDSTMDSLKTIEKKREAVESEKEQLVQLLQSTKEGMKRTIDKTLDEVQRSFSKFIGSATNGEVKAELSDDLTPSIDGRRIFDPQDTSSSEKTLMDFAFRFAVLDAYAKRASITPLMVVETPEEAVAEPYSAYLAETMVEYSKHLLLITTTKSASLMKGLLKPYDLQERKKRLVDLVSIGTTTQARYYQSTLASLFGGT
jgi:predicted  nucleic acid-binding Zn-ribbon protein